MSEYQYHEWQAVDRVLTPEEQDAVNDLSSHIEVNPSRAVVTYHWSNCRHDPKQVLQKYFDAYFYLANWGSLRLMFRFPKGLLDEAEKKRQAEAALQKNIVEMKALAAREAQVWQQVETLLDTGRKIALVYDDATELLDKLKQLSEFQDTRDVFWARLHRLAQKYASRPSLIDR
jgi:hypothetical protein